MSRAPSIRADVGFTRFANIEEHEVRFAITLALQVLGTDLRPFSLPASLLPNSTERLVIDQTT